MQEDLRLKDYYKIFMKNKWLIGIFTFIVSVLAIVISLLLPLWYAGTAQIIRPQSQILNMNSIQMQTMNLFGAADGPTNRYLSILNSRLLKEKVCKKYNLQEAYKQKGMDKTVLKFEDNYDVELGDENQLMITVFDRDQQRVADMANYVVFLLDSINTSLNSKYGSQERVFIEGQLQGIMDSLNVLEKEFLFFMNENNVLSIEDQMKTEVEFATELKYQLLIKQTELKVMKQTRQNDVLIDAKQTEINELQDQYDKLFLPDHELFVDLNRAPEIAMYAQRLEREIDYFNEVLVFIGPLYEQAKISEAKVIPTFEVLDYAHKPDRKAKPKRAIIVISAFMFALLSSGVYVLLKETQD